MAATIFLLIFWAIVAYVMYLNRSANKILEWRGGSYPGARPKYEGTSVLAGVKIARDKGWHNQGDGTPLRVYREDN